jgi:hypothetical protein
MRAELKDFSGGITDFIFTNDITCCEIAENKVITKDKALVTRWGSRVMDAGLSRPETTATIPGMMIESQGIKYIIYGGQILAWDGSTWTEVIGANTLAPCLTEGGNSSRISFFEWNKHLFITDDQGSKTIKLFRDASDDYQVRTAGLPYLASTPTVTPDTNDGATYIYYFHYYYSYSVGDVTHVDYGPVIELLVNNASDFTGDGNEITSIPVLANTDATHYDIANIKIKIYRSIDTGTEGYLVGTIDNGVTTFSDNTNDEDLVLNELLYISSGASDNIHPPVAKFIDICSNAAWYANVAGYPYRAIQSQLSDPDSVPDSYYVDFEEEIVGWSSFQSYPIAFTENQMWRIEGVVEIDGTGEHRKVMIADGVTAINHNSIVKTDKGVYFAGPDSFYWTDGYTTKKIPGDERNIPTRYREFSGNTSNIKGSFDRINNRIMWTVKVSSTEFYIYVYDLTFNALTTWAGQPDDFKPSAILCSKDGYIYRADESGYIFVHDPLYYSDPVIDDSTPSDEWYAHPVIDRFRHIAFDFGVSDVNKWVTRLTVSGEGRTALDVAISSYDDSTVVPKELVPLEHKNGLVWNDPFWIWESEIDIWGLEVRLNQTRYFKSGKLRCKRKQIEFTNAFVTISSSDAEVGDTFGTVDSVAKTFTIIDKDLVYIPGNIAGMEMVINDVNYVIESVNTATGVFTLIDTSDQLVDGAYEWEIQGYPSNQRFHLASVIFTYENLDDKGGYFQRGVTINA